MLLPIIVSVSISAILIVLIFYFLIKLDSARDERDRLWEENVRLRTMIDEIRFSK